MTPNIRILSESIANKIAAGEVVERPASVAKELLENALDADATEIRIEISAGGRRLIRVIDNGHGMSREDARMALERHATSKISNDSDLEAISSLGFRGEALPSLASVSRLRLKSRTKDGIAGTEIFAEGGTIRTVTECGMAVGTDITVEQLFYNTPARLKFMRSAETESAHLADLVVRTAISRPDVAFSYSNNNREQLRVSPGSLLQRLQQLVAKDTELFEVNGESAVASISGYLAPPTASRSSSSAIYTYINGRFVRDKVVQHAVMQAFRPVLERGRYPLVALFIQIPPGEVDVNVHPTKHEVRFRQQSQVHDTIQGVIEETLRHSPWLQQRQYQAGQPLTTAMHPHNSADSSQKRWQSTQPDPIPGIRQAVNRFISDSASRQAGAVFEQPQGYAARAVEQRLETVGYFENLEIIGQFRAAYILCQGEDRLVIIDQHAAYERVRFEQLKRSFNENRVESQGLLLPETVELSFLEVDTLQQFQHLISDIGFDLELFGGQTWRINAVPQIIANSNVINLLRDILSELASNGSQTSFDVLVDDLLSRIACHSVVRGRHQLDHRQMKELLKEMDRTDFSAHCPHGRPVSHQITLFELEKLFSRR
jgi:DNA mismatch repair protein MutL